MGKAMQLHDMAMLLQHGIRLRDDRKIPRRERTTAEIRDASQGMEADEVIT